MAGITPSMTIDELLALPASVSLETAGRPFGLGRTSRSSGAQSGEFPCTVLRVGKRYRVTRSAIFEALGLDPVTGRQSAIVA